MLLPRALPLAPRKRAQTVDLLAREVDVVILYQMAQLPSPISSAGACRHEPSYAARVAPKQQRMRVRAHHGAALQTARVRGLGSACMHAMGKRES